MYHPLDISAFKDQQAHIHVYNIYIYIHTPRVNIYIYIYCRHCKGLHIIRHLLVDFHGTDEVAKFHTGLAGNDF